MLVNRLLKNQLFLHHGFEGEIPIEVVSKEAGGRGDPSFSAAVKGKQSRSIMADSLEIQPACFRMDPETGKLEPYKIHVQWKALFSIWLKRLHVKKPGRINKQGWALSIVQEIQGQTRRNGSLPELLYKKMINSFVFAEKTMQEISTLLIKAVEEHLGKDRHLFAAAAFLACIRLKDKFGEDQRREIWDQIMAHASKCYPDNLQQALSPDHFSVQLETIVSDGSIPLQVIADVIQLCGLFRLSSTVEDTHSDVSFVFKQHLDQAAIQVRIAGQQACCLNIPFDAAAGLNNLLKHGHLFKNPVLAGFCRQLFKPVVIKTNALSALERDCEPLNLDYAAWGSLGFNCLRQEASFLKESGWNILLIATVYNPSEEGLKALIAHVLDLIGGENQDEIRRIFHALVKSKSLHPKELIYLTEAADSLGTYLALEKQPGGSQRTSLEVRSQLGVKWLEQLAKSSNVLLAGLACDLAEKFVENDPGRVSPAYSLVKVLSESNDVRKSIGLMEFLQNQKNGRTIKEEIGAFCALAGAAHKRGVSFYKPMGQICLRMIRKWNAKTAISPHDLLNIVQFLKAMWNIPEHAAIALSAFKEMMKKGFLTEELISEEYWLDAGNQGLESPSCGLSTVFEIWQTGLKNWKPGKGYNAHVEFCFKLLQACEDRQIEDADMYGSIFNELFSNIQSFKETDYGLFLEFSKKIEVFVSRIKYIQTHIVKNSLGKEFLIRLQLSELAHFIQKKEWGFALNTIRIILENDFLRTIDKSYYLTFSEHLEDFIQQVSLSSQDLLQLFEILKNPFLEEKIFDGRRSKYISILSSSFKKFSGCNPCFGYDVKMLDLFLMKAESVDDFIPCAASILQTWKRLIKARDGLAKISKTDFLFKAFVKSRRFNEAAELIIFLKKQSFPALSEGMLNNAWSCLKQLSLSPIMKIFNYAEKRWIFCWNSTRLKKRQRSRSKFLKISFFQGIPLILQRLLNDWISF